MATLTLKLSRNKHRAVIVFLWGKNKCKSGSLRDAYSIWWQALCEPNSWRLVYNRIAIY